MGLLTDLISKVGLDTKDFERNLDRASRQLERKGRRMSLIGNDLTNNVSLPILAMGGFAVKSAADIERLELALKNTMGGDYIQELAKLKEAAKDPGLGFKQAVRGSVALQSVGESAQSARKMMQEWGNAVAAAGGTATNLNQVVVQLQQSLSKQGALLREDWKFIVQQAPQAQKALMDLYGTGDLEEIGKRGHKAKEVIDAVTQELAKLGRVEGGIANQFVNFKDQLEQTLAPLGKMIFESAALKDMMASIISTVMSVANVFGRLSPTMQKLIVQFLGTLAVMGPFMRVMGSSILIWGQFYTGVARALIKMKPFIDVMTSAAKPIVRINAAMSASQIKLKVLTSLAKHYGIALAGAMGIGAVGAIATSKGIGLIAEKMGKLAANNPGSIWAKTFDPSFFVQYGHNASTKWVEGFTNEVVNQKKKLREGIENAITGLNITGIFTDSVSTPGNELWFESPKTWADELSDWAKALAEVRKELAGINELEKLLGKSQNAMRYDALWSQVVDGLTKFGLAADSPEIQALLNQMKEVRGVVQGIANDIPKLNLLPKFLEPTGGIPDIGSESVARIQQIQRKMSDATKSAFMVGSFRSMDNAVIEGMLSSLEASIKIYDKYGSDAAHAYLDGFSKRIREGMQVVEVDIQSFAQAMASTMAIGLSDTLGSIMGGENPAKALIEGFLIPITDILRQFGEMMITTGASVLAFKSSFVNPIAAIGLGVAAIVAASAAKKFFQSKVTSLAEGGIATGPTQALVGDNPKSPELITPLHKLPGLMRSVMGSEGGPTIRLLGDFEIKGDKLTYFIDEQISLRKSISMY